MVLGMEATHRLITLGPASAMSTVAYSANTLTESVLGGAGRGALLGVLLALSLRNYGQPPP